MSLSYTEYCLLMFLLAVAADTAAGLIPHYREFTGAFFGVPSFVANSMIKRLNRSGRSDTVLRFRAVMFVLLTGVLLYFGTLFFDDLIPKNEVGTFLKIILISTAIPCCSGFLRVNLHKTGSDMKRKIADIGIPTAVAGQEKDVHGLSRLYIEQTALRFLNIAACAFCYILPCLFGYDGLPFLAVYLGINAGVMQFRYGFSPYTPFAAALFFIYEVIMFVPSVTAAVFLWIATLCVPGTSVTGAIKTVIGHAHKHRLSPFGRVYAVFSGALGVSLGGRVFDGEWIGPETATARASDSDAERGLLLYYAGLLIIVGTITAFLFIRLS